jgi:hypothetical protein
MRGHISSKSCTCTEGVVVYAAGISGKVGAHYPGRSVGNAGGKDKVEILWHRRETSRKQRRQSSTYVLVRKQPIPRGVAEPAEVSRGHIKVDSAPLKART